MKSVSNLALAAVAFLYFAAPALSAAEPPKKEEVLTGPVSYYKNIRPIFQANCQGCHQPAKAKGGYVMTDFAKMLAGGDGKDTKDKKDNQAAIVPKNPAASYLIAQITPIKGEAEMPKGKPPLAEKEIALVTRWIAEGASDDTPANVVQRYDLDHLPEYILPPIITSLDYSPDGQLLAVSGFHEVLLHKADGSGLAARLVGLSERIESVRFSPDGKLLAVAGGQPARMGEVQVWDVETKKLKISVPVTYDTVYGVSWSDDGKLIAFGCADNQLRAIDATNGKQVLQQGSHSDWVLDTAFSLKGDHIISVGRDMSAKLTEVATQRFVDNITSITPGALRGGLHSVVRHPTREQFLVGGSDGAPQIYRIFRQTARKIGDNANLIRKFPDMTGRIFSVRYSKDGSQFAAASSLDNTGQVVIYSADVNATVPDDIKKIMAKTVQAQTADEKMNLDKFQNEGTKLIAKAEFPATGIYSVAFSPDGKTLAAAGQDGTIRFIQTSDGKIAKEIPAAPLSKGVAARKTSIGASNPQSLPPAAMAMAMTDAEQLPKNATVVALEVQPSSVMIHRPTETVQFLVSARMQSGESVDVTRLAAFKLDSGIARVTPRGNLSPSKDGRDELQVSIGGATAKVPVEIAGVSDDYKVDFIHDVSPILSKAGCNAGTCHGAKDGKNGFKLSLRGYDPIMDVRAFGDDLASRRINAASPDDSLMLLKPTAGVPHEGGQRLKLDEKYYQVIRQWIADGAKLNSDAPHVTKIEVFPKNPVIQSIGSRQQMRVVATYANGEARDVTLEAFIESGNNDVAITDGTGLITTVRRGEAPVLARFEGNYAATTVTVMGDRTGFVWQDPPVYGRIDELVAAKWKRMQIQPSDMCSDTEFIRRVFLDLTGLPPSLEEVMAFQSDTRASKLKREELIDKLIGSPEFIDHWTYKWADLLEVNRKFLGPEGSSLFRDWIRKQIEANLPYDEFARQIITATGSNKDNPPASYFKVLREPAETMENTTHLFLATRFNCNKCHDHPFERWTQDQYYQTAAFFAQVDLKADPASGTNKIGGTAVENAKPLFEIVGDKKDGDVKHLRTGNVAPPKFPFEARFEVKDPAKTTRRQQLAAWLTSPDNRYFAMSYANRMWGYLLGVGIIEPLDDIRAGNPATDPELLEYLTREFIDHKFDVRHLMRIICKSRAYQLSIVPNKWNADDKINYSHATTRRLPAEVLYDSVFKVTGSIPNFPGLKPGTRAAQLPDSGVDLPSGFLATLGRPPRESACECERSNDIRLGSVMSLLSGPTIGDAIGDPNNAIVKLVASQSDDRKLVNEIYLRVLNREATEAEISGALNTLSNINEEHPKLVADLATMETKFAPIIAEQERQRLAAIEKAKTALADYEKATAPKIAEDTKKREERIAESEKALKEYEAALPQKLTEWEKSIPAEQRGTIWTQLEVTDYKATGGVRLERIIKDGSIRASGPTAQTEYSVGGTIPLAGITGVKLEVLPDEKAPMSGPGRSPEGNFVLTELKLEWKTEGDKTTSPVKLADARADFSQKDFDVKNALTGKDAKKGWAVAGVPAGQMHQATFKLEKPIGNAKGAVLKFTLVQKYADTFSIARFRIWVTTSAQPLAFGLPAFVAKALKLEPLPPATDAKEAPKTAAPVPAKEQADAAKTAAPTPAKELAETPKIAATPAKEQVEPPKAEPPKLTKEQSDELLEYFRIIDPQLRKKQQALTAAKQPLPADPKLAELKNTFAKSQEPIQIEPKLIQLRADVAMSTQQINNKRLTGAQDLTWALINSSAFLFNH